MEEALPTTIVALLTLVSPLITAFFTKANMSAQAKNWIAVAISAVIALVYVFMQGGFNALQGPEEYLAALGIAYGIGQLVYNAVLKKPATLVEAKYGITAKEAPENVTVVETKAADGSEVVIAVPDEYRGSTQG